MNVHRGIFALDTCTDLMSLRTLVAIAGVGSSAATDRRKLGLSYSAILDSTLIGNAAMALRQPADRVVS